MTPLQDLPINQKLTLVILLSCSLVLLLAGGGMTAYQALDTRRMLVRDTTSLAALLAENTRAALAFQDAAAAQETLRALQEEPYVLAAALYTPDGARFAGYARAGAPALPSRPPAAGYLLERRRLVLVRPVVLDGRRLGTIYLLASLAEVYGRLRLFGGISAAILLLSLSIALLLSRRLQHRISQPILALAGAARAVAEGKDYTVRVDPQGRDEVGHLAESFNHMLAAIEQRDSALRQEVAERKAAETRVQAQLARLQLLHQISRAIGERQDLQSIFQAVLVNLEDHLPVDFACMCLYDEARTLTVAGVGGRSIALAEELGLKLAAAIPTEQNGLLRCVQGVLVHEPDLRRVPFPFPQKLAQAGLGALVAAPMMVESQIFGALLAGRRQPDSFSSAECEFLRQLSEHVGLAAHAAQLYGALQQAYDDLRQTQQTVMQQERLRALGQMASGIAHDINNAISPVALYTELMLENEPNLSARTRGYLETIQRSIEDVAATVARMREFYRQREPQLTLMPVHLSRLVEQVVDLSRARWSDMPQQRGLMIHLKTELAPDLPPVAGVDSEIREALINLVFNAVDAMPEGGKLTLRTGLVARRADENGPPGSRHVFVEVSDTGIGMSEDTRRRCLEPFFTTKGDRGTGLGLAMVYGTVRRHGAEIEIESAPGQGTTMRLVFAAPEGVAGEAAAAATPAALSRLRLLVVDDDPLLIKSLRDSLETDGHVVVTAPGGQAGLEAFRAGLARGEPFSAVITDLGMPYVDGRKVAAGIKEASPSTPVILLTGWGQRLAAEGDRPPHVDCVLSKPPKLRELREALARCLPPGAS